MLKNPPNKAILDAETKVHVEQKKILQPFFFPEYGVTIEAENLGQAHIELRTKLNLNN